MQKFLTTTDNINVSRLPDVWFFIPLPPKNHNFRHSAFFCLNYYTGLIERNELESEKPEFKTKDAEIRYLRDKVGLYGNTHRIDGINPK